MDWTLAEIRSKLRELTSRQDANQVAATVLDAEINAFYQHQLPDEIQVHAFRGWTEFETVAGTGDYDQPDTVLGLGRPVTVKDSDDVVFPVARYTQPDVFQGQYPLDGHDESAERNRPQALLVYGNVYTLRPVPDAVYTIRYASVSQLPTALSGDGATPVENKWGPAIAYGTAIEYLTGHGRKEAADEIAGIYQAYISSINRKYLRQIPVDHRARPRF